MNRKTKTEMKTLKENHGKCCKWMIMTQGTVSWMKEDLEKTEPKNKKEKKEVRGDAART